MKRIKLRYLMAGFVALLLLGACNDDLDRFPHSSIEQSQSFETVEDAATWNTGMYGLLRGRVNGIFMYSTDIQADQLNATLDYGNRNGGVHRWDFTADDYTIRDTWQLYYSGVTNANVAIEGIASVESESEEEQMELNRYLSEAYLVRAFYYHQLVTRFAKDYDPASASSDPGVPLMLEYDIENFAARSSVEEVYQQILSDIQAAKTGLSEVPGAPGSIRFSKDVVVALEARVRFHMEDWAGAKVAADQLISSGTYSLYDTEQGLESMWHEDSGQEDILQLFVSNPDELANANSVYQGYNAGTGRYTPDFLPSQDILDLFDDNDYRKAVYFEELPVTMAGSEYDNLMLVDKYPGNPDLYTGTTNYQHAPKIFRIAEMYLISAESASRLGNDNEALEAINSLRTARGLDALSGMAGSTLLVEIKAERTRELAFEGFRLDDLKRWDEGMDRMTPQNMDVIMTGPLFYSLSKDASDNKFIWAVPQNDITVNPNITQNPGW